MTQPRVKGSGVGQHRLVASLAIVIALTALASAERVSGDASAQLQRGRRLFDKQQYRDAIPVFEEATRGDDTRITVAARKGVIRSALRVAEFQTAARHVAALYSDAPRDPEALALTGDALWALGFFDEAERRYRESLMRFPEFSSARVGVARALASRNRLRDAIDEARAAVASAPDDPDAQAALAEIARRLFRYDEAEAALTRYTALLEGIESDKAQRTRGQLQLLRDFRGRQPLQIDAASATVPHTIPFRVVAGKVIVQASVNGRPPVDFIVDTGAEDAAALSRPAAEDAGVRPVAPVLSAGVGGSRFGSMQLARMQSLRIGSLEVHNVPGVIRGVEGSQFNSLSPIPLGLSMTLDYRTLTMTLAREVPDDADAERISLRVHRLPFVRGSVNGTQLVSFLVDTGAEGISIGADTAESLPVSSRRIPLQVRGATGVDNSAFLMVGMSFDVGSLIYRNTPLVVLNLRAPSVLLGMQVGGILGHQFLSDYRVTLDLPRSELRLVKQ